MLTQEATPEMLEEWKKVWNEYLSRLKPNRRTGRELVHFLQSKYSLTELYDDHALQVVIGNVLDNEPYSEKLLPGEKPLPKAFLVDNTGLGQILYQEQDEARKGVAIFVGVDLATGFYCVENSILLWDELCAYQGLDEKDIQNCFCVFQYIECLKRFGLMEKLSDEGNIG